MGYLKTIVMPDEWNLKYLPELPVMTFKADGVKYTVTDMRYLKEAAFDIFRKTVNVIADDPDIETVAFNCTGHTDEDVRLVEDILLGMMYTAHKGGRYGFDSMHKLLFTGVKEERLENGALAIHMNLMKEHVKPIHDYVNSHDEISIVDMVVAIFKHYRESQGG